MTPTIFLDMDGVLSDIEHGIHLKYGYKVDVNDVGENTRSKFFKEFLPSYVGENGFEYERVCENSHLLVDELYKIYDAGEINIAILTSSGDFYQPNSEVVFQKKKFIERNFPELIKVPFCVTTAGREKARLAHPFAMLIDDHIKNCVLFSEAGGEAFIYQPQDAQKAVAAVKNFVTKTKTFKDHLKAA